MLGEGKGDLFVCSRPDSSTSFLKSHPCNDFLSLPLQRKPLRPLTSLFLQSLPHSSFTLLQGTASHVVSFQQFAHSLQKHRACTPVLPKLELALVPSDFREGASSILSPIFFRPRWILCLRGKRLFPSWLGTELTPSRNQPTLEIAR